MNPAEFLLDLANGNINDVSVPSELDDKVQMGNAEVETTYNGKPSPAVVHEVTFTFFFYYTVHYSATSTTQRTPCVTLTRIEGVVWHLTCVSVLCRHDAGTCIMFTFFFLSNYY